MYKALATICRYTGADGCDSHSRLAILSQFQKSLLNFVSAYPLLVTKKKLEETTPFQDLEKDKLPP